MSKKPAYALICLMLLVPGLMMANRTKNFNSEMVDSEYFEFKIRFVF